MTTADEGLSIYQSWTDEELLRAAGEEREEYRPEAVAAIEVELERRGVDASKREEMLENIVQEDERREHDLRGVRGWLALFALVVLFNSLPWVLTGVERLWGHPLAGLSFLPWMAVGAYGCYVFGALLLKRPTAPRHAARWLVATVGVPLLYVLLVYLSSGQALVAPVFRAPLLIWLWYLTESKRVAATYGEPSEELASVAEVFD